MGKPEVLARVDDDLARGHTHVAAQRLNSLIAADPYDLALRARLRDVHRMTGNVAEAGRWGYLTEDVTAIELEAFEKSHHRSPSTQLRALSLHGEHPRDLGPHAERRLAHLTGPATRCERPPGPSNPSHSPDQAGSSRSIGSSNPNARVDQTAVPPSSALDVPNPSGPAPYPLPLPAPYDPDARPPAPDRTATLSEAIIGSIMLLTVAVLAGLGVVTVISWFL